MFTFTKTATSDLRQAHSSTSGSSEVNLHLQLALSGVMHTDLDTMSP